MAMTKKEAVDYIEGFGWSKDRFDIDGSRSLLNRLGNPQNKLKFVHVAGSNGKGSTCAMLDSILRAAGYKVGLYTSPYIQDFCERMQVGGENIPGETLSAVTEKVKAEVEASGESFSQFTVMTAVAMEYFYESGCDIVVLEVGMGGELDATNVIEPPEAAVIMNIGLEHTEYLGDTLEKIAMAKAGIIKPGCRAVCYDGAPEVTEVIKAVCAERNVPLRCVNFGRMEALNETLDGQEFLWDGEKYRVNLIGPHQLHNTCAVMETVETLRERGWKISDEAVREGLAAVKWPARLEVLDRDPLFFLDGGHNPQCAEALAEAVKKLLGDKKAVFLLGVLADKDYPTIMKTVMPLAKKFICLTPFSDRALPAKELAKYLRAQGAKASASNSVEEGIIAARKAAGKTGAVVSFGSLYLAGHVRGVYQEMYGKK